MSDHAAFEETCALYALGALDALATDDFERHLRECPPCRTELEGWRETVHALPYSLAPVPPPPAARQRLLARLAAPAGVVTLRRSWVWAGVAALLLITISSTLALSSLQAQLRERDQTIAALENAVGQVQEKDRALATLRQAVAKQEDTIHLFNDDRLETFQLAGLKDAPQARARVFWNREKNVWLFFVSGLPAPPAGKTYQLWYINKQSQKISAGTFMPTPLQGSPLPYQFQVPPPAQTLAAAAVTLEPAGGVAQPTGSIYLIGKPSV